jgi:hypothetical protein
MAAINETEMYDIAPEDLEIKDEELQPQKEKDYKCAPSKKFTNWSCIPLQSLVHMANAFNEENPSSKIRTNDKYIKQKPDKYKRYLLKQFKKKLTKCDDQVCWTKQSFMKRLNKTIKEDIQTNTFRPEGPNKGNKWLNTLDICKACKQYEFKYNDFIFLGALPRDFDKISKGDSKYGIPVMTELGEIVNMDLNKIYPEKTKIGVVFNLDQHDEPGSHWVAMYADLNKGQCYFSDSYGMEPLKEIQKLMGRITDFIETVLNKKITLKYSKKEHQRGGSECGVYSISFILRMLKGDTFEEINSKRIPDETINKCRNHYFTEK